MISLVGFEFVKTVETLLAVRGISKKEFYEKSGVSDALMSQYRSEPARSPRNATIQKAAAFFGMDYQEFGAYLQTLNDPQAGTKKAPSQMAEGQSAAKQALVQFILRMPDDQAEELLSELASRLSMGSTQGADPESR